jgi:ABC-2 type transport system permease protein
MSQIVTIAKEEWRYWLRSRLVKIGLIVFALLLILTSALTASRVSEIRHDREHQQEKAEQSFREQPDRHPHRMVHYGHYAFRAPTPLAQFDPGVDAVTGQSIFLEGHRQNSAMFAEARGNARAGGFGSLTPALIYQLFLPLLLIAIAHAAIVREREARTLVPLMSQGVNGPSLYLGKGLAILALIMGLSLPALFGSSLAITQGESALTALSLYGSYSLYLAIWGSLILTVSCLVRSRGIALGLMLLVWIFSALVVPRIAVTWASYSLPSEGKIITSMRMNEDLRKLGDGHNAADPAFAKFRSNILAQYDVDNVDELPVNFRGLVAQQSEVELTATLNKYAEKRMSRELEQSTRLDSFGVISPYVAIGTASRSLAGTDLSTHHRFLRETEDLRFNFVQGLNKVHIKKLSYADDMARNKDEEAGKRARVSSENWQILQDFRFQPDSASTRFNRAAASLLSLLIWLLVILFIGLFTSRKLQP